MICKSCCEAADYPEGGTVVWLEDGKPAQRVIQHCANEGCACQHLNMKKEEYLNG